MQTVNPSGQIRRQGGAALVVGLILLLILTVLGVSGMSGATLELAMAGNTQQQQHAFFAAESALDSAVMQPGGIAIDAAVVNGDDVGDTLTFEYKPDGKLLATIQARTQFRVQRFTGFAPNGSDTSMSYVHFQAEADATTTGRGARSVQQAGYFIMAPSP